MKLCLHRHRPGLHTPADPTLMARYGALCIMLRLGFLVSEGSVLYEIPSIISPVAVALFVLATIGAVDVLCNNLLRGRYAIPMLRRLRFLIYMLAAIATLVIAMGIQRFFAHSHAFVITYMLISAWFIAIAVQDLLYAIKTNAL